MTASLICTLKTEQPPSEVIQERRIVCEDAMRSIPIAEVPHSGSLLIRGRRAQEMGRWSVQEVDTIQAKEL